MAMRFWPQHFAGTRRAAQEWKATRKLQNDPRVTRVGAVLRKLSLDELPQMFNILRGDMSFVGPRPVVKDELELYGSAADYYLKSRPGLTGLWQVSGRNDVSYGTRVAFDRHYVENWSFVFDLKIIIRTVPAVSRHAAATDPRSRGKGLRCHTATITATKALVRHRTAALIVRAAFLHILLAPAGAVVLLAAALRRREDYQLGTHGQAAHPRRRVADRRRRGSRLVDDQRRLYRRPVGQHLPALHRRNARHRQDDRRDRRRRSAKACSRNSGCSTARTHRLNSPSSGRSSSPAMSRRRADIRMRPV